LLIVHGNKKITTKIIGETSELTYYYYEIFALGEISAALSLGDSYAPFSHQDEICFLKYHVTLFDHVLHIVHH